MALALRLLTMFGERRMVYLTRDPDKKTYYSVGWTAMILAQACFGK